MKPIELDWRDITSALGVAMHAKNLKTLVFREVDEKYVLGFECDGAVFCVEIELVSARRKRR